MTDVDRAWELEAALRSPSGRFVSPKDTVKAQARYELDIRNGIAVIGSDAHYRPGLITAAHRAIRLVIRELRPQLVILNGDVMDFPQISKHPTIGWETMPTVKDEIACAQERMQEIEYDANNANPMCDLVWTLGNHDMRFETRLATVAPEYAEVFGVHLQDHFPAWAPAWSCWVNGDTVIKHRFKGGDNAAYNNAVRSGLSIVTGHLHSLRISPFTDYRGTRFGVDSGTLAAAYGPQFVDYTEDNPVNWRSGGVVLTWKDGRLLWPEVFHVIDEQKRLVSFRGSVLHV